MNLIPEWLRFLLALLIDGIPRFTIFDLNYFIANRISTRIHLLLLKLLALVGIDPHLHTIFQITIFRFFLISNFQTIPIPYILLDFFIRYRLYLKCAADGGVFVGQDLLIGRILLPGAVPAIIFTRELLLNHFTEEHR